MPYVLSKEELEKILQFKERIYAQGEIPGNISVEYRPFPVELEYAGDTTGMVYHRVNPGPRKDFVTIGIKAGGEYAGEREIIWTDS